MLTSPKGEYVGVTPRIQLSVFVTPTLAFFRRCDMIFPSWLGFCLLFCILFMSCISSSHHLQCIGTRCHHYFFNLLPLVVAASPLAFVDRPESNRVFVSFFSDHLTSLASSQPPRARPKLAPNPIRSVMTVGSGSSPNVYKTSPFSNLDSLDYFFSTVRFNQRVQT